jgi:hypothetical protein
VQKRIEKMGALQNKIINSSTSKMTLPEVLNAFGMIGQVPSLNFTESVYLHVEISKETTSERVKELVDKDLKRLEVANEIKHLWKYRGSVFGNPGIGPERKKCIFISDVISITLSVLQLRIKVIMDELFGEGHMHGAVDFVFHDSVFNRVVLLIEAKNDDFDQGEAQMILALHATKQKQNVFGFVSNSILWIPYVHTKEGKFFKGNEMLIPSQDPSVNDIVKVVSVLEWMCTSGLSAKIDEK